MTSALLASYMPIGIQPSLSCLTERVGIGELVTTHPCNVMLPVLPVKATVSFAQGFPVRVPPLAVVFPCAFGVLHLGVKPAMHDA